MTVAYDWAYLCNNPRRLAITLRLLPRDRPFEGLRTMHVCYASHLDGPVSHTLANVAMQHRPSWLDVRVTDLSPAVMNEGKFFPPEFGLYFSNGKPRWSLGMKLLLPYIFDGPYLYTDDDVIVPNDPQALMSNSFGSKGCFRFAGKKLGVRQQLFEAFDLPPRRVECDGVTLFEYNYDERALDAGVWFHMGDPDVWKMRLHRFTRLPYIKDLTTHNLELRCLDQRFLTMFGMKYGWDQLTIGNGFAPPKEIRPSLLKNKYFFHYKSQSKEAWMRLFEAYISDSQA